MALRISCVVVVLVLGIASLVAAVVQVISSLGAVAVVPWVCEKEKSEDFFLSAMIVVCSEYWREYYVQSPFHLRSELPCGNSFS